jgi:hypothetical protein
MKGTVQAQTVNHQEGNSKETYLVPKVEEEEVEKLDATHVARQDTCLGTILKINQQIRGIQML